MANTKRFALGNPEELNSSIWRFWTTRNDIYVAARSIAGVIKTSLHESGVCQTSLTSEYIKKNEQLMERRLRKPRHLKTWNAVEINKGLWQLLNVAIPNDNLKKLLVDQTIAQKVEWVKPLTDHRNTQFTFFKSNNSLEDASWIGEGCNLFYKGKLNNSENLCVLIYGTDFDLKKITVVNDKEKRDDENYVYRAIRLGVAPINQIGYLVDG